MIWESVPIMTLVDLSVIIFTVLVAGSLHKAYSDISETPGPGLYFVVGGLGMVALFHLADLIVMHIVPLLVGDAEALAFMKDLHLNYRWPVTFFAYGAIAIGCAMCVRLSAMFEQMRMSDERFTAFAEEVSDYLWETDEEHRFSYLSPGADSFDPNSRAIKLGTRRSDWRLAADEYDAKWEALAADLDARRPFRQVELTAYVTDGSIRHVVINGWPVFSAAGEFTGYRGIGSDITEKKHTENALRESEAGLAKAQSMTHIGNWVRDYKTGTLTWSEEVFRIFGHEPNAFVPEKSHFTEAIHPRTEKETPPPYGMRSICAAPIPSTTASYCPAVKFVGFIKKAKSNFSTTAFRVAPSAPFRILPSKNTPRMNYAAPRRRPKRPTMRNRTFSRP